MLVGAWVIKIKLIFRANTRRGEIKSLVLVAPLFFMASLYAHSKFDKGALYIYHQVTRGLYHLMNWPFFVFLLFLMAIYILLYYGLCLLKTAFDHVYITCHILTKKRQRNYNISSAHICRLVLYAHQPFMMGVKNQVHISINILVITNSVET